MKIPTIYFKDQNSVDIYKKEFDVIQGTINRYLVKLCSAFNIEESKAGELLEELFSKLEILNFCKIRSIGNLNSDFFLKMTTYEGFPAAPGTILNAAFLYILIRYFNLKNVFEAGTASGFYSTFLLLAVEQTGGHLDTVDLLTGDGVGENILYPNSKCFSLFKGQDSISFLKEKNAKGVHYDLYCHDSTHRFPHMLKELSEFKKCKKDSFFCFFDDQRSDNFWQRCIDTKLFNKSGYNIKFTNEDAELGGFIKYER